MENYEANEGNGKKTLWIIGGIVLVLAIVGVIYGATQRTIKNTGQTGDVNVPLNGDNNEVAGARVNSPVTYTGMDIVNLQTFPYRVQVRVRGTVPEGCATADVPTVTTSGKTFTVTMTGSKPEGAVCTQVMTNVENTAELPVAGLAAGTYTVKLGTLPAKTFTLSSDNAVQYSGDK